MATKTQAANPHKSYIRLAQARMKAEAALLREANRIYRNADRLEKAGRYQEARALATQAKRLMQRASSTGKTEGPVGKLPNSKAKRRSNPTAAGLKRELAEVDRDIAELETDAFYKETQGRRMFARKWLAHHRRERRKIEQLLKGLALQNPAAKSKDALLAMQLTAQRAQMAAEAVKQKYGYGSLRHKAAQVAYKTASQRYQRAKAKNSQRNPGAPVTYKIAMAAGRDAANRRMKAAGRNKWSQADYNEGVRVFRSLYGNQHQVPHKRNPGIIDLAAGLQAADYLASRLGSKKKRKNPARSQRAGVKNPDEIHRAIRRAIERLRKTIDESEAYNRAYRQLVWEYETAGYTEQQAGDLANAQARRIRQRRKKKNPSVKAVSKMFQGKTSGAVAELSAPNNAPADLARIGKLVFLKLESDGKQLRIPGAMVAADGRGKLWIVGGKFTRRAQAGQRLDYGPVSHICYLTAKRHIGGSKTFEYLHEFGENGGKRPSLHVDSEGFPLLSGGAYKLTAAGIEN